MNANLEKSMWALQIETIAQLRRVLRDTRIRLTRDSDYEMHGRRMYADRVAADLRLWGHSQAELDGLMIETIGYEHSGLPSYGLDEDRLSRRRYALYRGSHPRARRGEWRLLGVLSAAAVDAIRSAPLGMEADTAERAALAAGLLG